MDKGIRLQKELAMGVPSAKREASGNQFRDKPTGKFKCGGAVKTSTKKGGKAKK